MDIYRLHCLSVVLISNEYFTLVTLKPQTWWVLFFQQIKIYRVVSVCFPKLPLTCLYFFFPPSYPQHGGVTAMFCYDSGVFRMMYSLIFPSHIVVVFFVASNKRGIFCMFAVSSLKGSCNFSQLSAWVFLTLSLRPDLWSGH